MDSPWLVVGLAAAGMVSLALYTGLLRRVFGKGGSAVEFRGFSWPDAVFAGVLGFCFLSLMWSASGERGALDLATVIRGSLVYASLVICILGFLTIRGISVSEALGLRGAGALRSIGVGLAWLAAAYPLILLAQVVSYSALPEGASPQDIVEFLSADTSWGGRMAVAVLAVGVAPVAEEVVFRGYLQGVLRQLVGRVAGLAIPSLLFAGIHSHVPSYLGLFVFGMALALIYERTGNLWASVAAHAVFNAVSVCAAIFWPWPTN